MVLGIRTKDDDHRLFRDIDPLPDKELIRLIENIKRFLKKASIVVFLDEFAQTPLGMTLPLTDLTGTKHTQKILPRTYPLSFQDLEAEEKVYNCILFTRYC